MPRPAISRTPRNWQHTHVTETKLLVAEHEEGRRRIRQRVRNVPSQQNQYAPPETSFVSHHDGPRSTTIRSRHNGLHHQTTTVQRIRLHTHHYGPRLHQGGTIHPL